MTPPFYMPPATGGGGGSGTVQSVATVEPDVDGNVPLTAGDLDSLTETQVLALVAASGSKFKGAYSPAAAYTAGDFVLTSTGISRAKVDVAAGSAISYVGGDIAPTASSTNVNTTLTLPGTAKAGDLAVIVIGGRSTPVAASGIGASGRTFTASGSQGWTGSPADGRGGVYVFHRTLTAADITGITVPLTGISPAQRFAVLRVYRGSTGTLTKTFGVTHDVDVTVDNAFAANATYNWPARPSAHGRRLLRVGGFSGGTPAASPGQTVAAGGENVQTRGSTYTSPNASVLAYDVPVGASGSVAQGYASFTNGPAGAWSGFAEFELAAPDTPQGDSWESVITLGGLKEFSPTRAFGAGDLAFYQGDVYKANADILPGLPVEYIGSTGNGSGTTIPLPAGSKVGDTVILTTGTGINGVPPLGTGFTLIGTQTGQNARISTSYKVLTSADVAAGLITPGSLDGAKAIRVYRNAGVPIEKGMAAGAAWTTGVPNPYSAAWSVSPTSVPLITAMFSDANGGVVTLGFSGNRIRNAFATATGSWAQIGGVEVETADGNIASNEVNALPVNPTGPTNFRNQARVYVEVPVASGFNSGQWTKVLTGVASPKRVVVPGNTNYTADGTEDVISFALTSIACTCTLPLPSQRAIGKPLTIVRENSNAAALTINPPGGGVYLDGSTAGRVLTIDYSSITVYSNGTHWVIVRDGTKADITALTTVADRATALEARKPGPNPRGDYSGATTYLPGDTVFYGGLTWYARVGSLNSPPVEGGAPPTFSVTSPSVIPITRWADKGVTYDALTEGTLMGAWYRLGLRFDVTTGGTVIINKLTTSGSVSYVGITGANGSSIVLGEQSTFPQTVTLAAGTYYMTIAVPQTGGTGTFQISPASTAVLAAGGGTWQKMSAAPSSRLTATKVTASLATDANEASTIALAKSFRALRVVTDKPARVRLYATAAQRDADAARPALTPINQETDHGLLLEFISGAGALTKALAPQIDGSNLEATPTAAIPCNITNLDATTGAVTVTLTYIATEA